MSWLARLSKLIDGGAKYDGKALGSLGETFLRASEDNPAYFQLPRGAPVGDPTLLAAKHGLNLHHAGYGRDELGIVGPQGNYSLYTRDTGRSAGQYADYLARDRYADREELAQMRQLLDQGALHPDTRMYKIDSSGSDRNTGTAKKGYPALWEYLMAHPDAANITDYLSNANTERRSTNMAGALERWGDRAGDRLIINKEQLGPVDRGSRVPGYQNLSTTEKIGLLNGLNAAHVDSALHRNLPYMPEHLQELYPAFDPKQLSSEGALSQLSGALREAGGRYNLANPNDSMPIPGMDSLRRAAIVAEQLNRPGLKPLDLNDRPWLTTGLARKRGGRV